MRTLWRLAASAIVLTALSGCVHTNAARLGTATADRAPITADRVALYRVASQVPRRYEEVAILNSTGDSGFTDEAKMFLSMKEAAGELGANGVILDAVSEPGHGAKVAAAIFGVSAQRKGKALAIYVFPDGDPQSIIPNVAASPTPATLTQPQPQPQSQSQSAEGCVSCANIGKGF